MYLNKIICDTLFKIAVKKYGGFNMKIWVDDIRPAPDGYIWCKSTNETIKQINIAVKNDIIIDVIDIDHDSGDFYPEGGDYIRVLNYLEQKMLKIPIRIHSMNPVGVENMRRIIKRNDWEEIL